MSETTPAGQITEPAIPEQGGLSTGAILLVLFAVINAWAAVALYHFWLSPPQKIAVVDVAAVYREQEAAFTKMVTKDNVTDVDRARALDRAEAFGQRLPVALTQIVDLCECTLLPVNAVAGGRDLPDYTDELRRLVGAFMESGR
ncbi:MAG: hypothetical protein RBS35_00820 [Azonexus sp.]|jgi:hypothetical protein|nr:hypothetical protein [Azonexus sp.]